MQVCAEAGRAAQAVLLFAGQWIVEQAGKFVRQAAERIQTEHEPENKEHVHRRSRKRYRTFDYAAEQARARRIEKYAVGAVLMCMLCFGSVKLGGYVYDYVSSRRASEELRAAYYAAMKEESPTPTVIPSTPSPTPGPTSTPEPQSTPAPTATPQVLLDTVRYPANPQGNISSRFQKIRRQNSDIVGWLSIDELVDEAVVQRDNSYYLRRDYRGYHNDNGAIFLDEDCDLDTRPYTMMLYGHNMKTGAMFGGLRNYENINFYRNNPFITFDTAYEDGRYVIFCVGTLSQNSRDRNFVDVKRLTSSKIVWREDAISQLKMISEISSGVDVRADDQILLLVTCVDDDAERRIVAARRIRDNETEESLLKLVKQSYSR